MSNNYLAAGVNSAYANVNAYNGGSFFTDTTNPAAVNPHAMPGISNNVAAISASKMTGGRRRKRSYKRSYRKRSYRRKRTYRRGGRRTYRRRRGGCGCNAAPIPMGASSFTGGRRRRRRYGGNIPAGSNVPPANIGYSVVPASGASLDVNRAMANPVTINPLNYGA